MNIQERIEVLETEFAGKIKALKAEVQRERDFPQDGDEYCYVDSDGDVLHDEWGGFASEEGMLEIGNVYKTKEQAECAVEKMKVEAELRKFSKRPNSSEVNWFIVCADSEEVYTLYTTQEISQGVIYFESKKVALEAIKSVGEDRIKKYLFGVEG